MNTVEQPAGDVPVEELWRDLVAVLSSEAEEEQLQALTSLQQLIQSDTGNMAPAVGAGAASALVMLLGPESRVQGGCSASADRSGSGRVAAAAAVLLDVFLAGVNELDPGICAQLAGQLVPLLWDASVAAEEGAASALDTLIRVTAAAPAHNHEVRLAICDSHGSLKRLVELLGSGGSECVQELAAKLLSTLSGTSVAQIMILQDARALLPLVQLQASSGSANVKLAAKYAVCCLLRENFLFAEERAMAVRMVCDAVAPDVPALAQMLHGPAALQEQALYCLRAVTRGHAGNQVAAAAGGAAVEKLVHLLQEPATAGTLLLQEMALAVLQNLSCNFANQCTILRMGILGRLAEACRGLVDRGECEPTLRLGALRLLRALARNHKAKAALVNLGMSEYLEVAAVTP